MSFGNKYYECCDVRQIVTISSYVNSMGYIMVEINKCHRSKVNNHNLPWAFILVTQIHNSPWV